MTSSVQEIKKAVSIRTEIANSVWARQRRRVKQDSAGPRERHPAQDRTLTPKTASLVASVLKGRGFQPRRNHQKIDRGFSR